LRLYINRLVGGTSDIRLYEGKTMSQAADLMKKLDHAKIWIDNIQPADRAVRG